MGKTLMCIKLLEILNSGRIYKISELADILETNNRNIIEYKEELEKCGYYIKSIRGRYGGYQLDKSYILPTLKLLSNEKEAILESFNYAMSKQDFIKKNDLSRAIGKVVSSFKIEENNKELIVVDNYKLNMSQELINERYQFIENAIKLQRVIEIEYASLKNGTRTHVLHPYKLFIYNNSWFFLAWNPEVGDVWKFKINRIINFKMLKDKFNVLKTFKAENYFDNNGFASDAKYIHVELIAKGVRKHLLKERIYGKNQSVIDIDAENAKVTLDMQDEEQIISFVLNCGTDVVLLEPKYMVEKVKAKAQEIYKLYE